MKTSQTKVIALAALLAASILSSRAATITQVADDNSGNTPDMNSGATWTGGAVPSGANDYVTTAGLEGASTVTGLPTLTGTLRAGGNGGSDGFGAGGGTETFGGNSLTITGHTRLLLRNGTIHNTSGDTVVVNNLTFNDQSILQWSVGITTGVVGNLNGSMQLASGGSVYVYNSTGANSKLNINSTLAGSGTLFMNVSPNTAQINLNGNISGFTGNLTYMSTGVFGISNSAPLSLLSTKMIFSNGVTAFNLNNNLTVGALIINSVSIANGTYTGAQLDTAAGVTTFSTLTNTITVQPFGPPVITAQPTGISVFSGTTVKLSATATGTQPLVYQWYQGTAKAANGANVSGALTNSLVITNLGPTYTGNYTLVITNAFGSATSTVATVSIVTPNSAYETAVQADGPAAFYAFDDLNNPATGGMPAYDYAAGANGTYGSAVNNGYNGVAGPGAGDGYAGFSSTNTAVTLTHGNANGAVAIPALNVNGNAFTFVAWVNPSSLSLGGQGLFYCRGGTTTAGLGYGSKTDLYGYSILTYNWGNTWESTNWSSGLITPAGVWSLVALVVTPTNATIHVINAYGMTSASQALKQGALAFDASALIGGDSADGGSGSRTFTGTMDEVALFKQSLTPAQIAGLYKAAGGSDLTPAVGSLQVTPAPVTNYVGQSVQFTAAAGAVPLPAYQWQHGTGGVYTNLMEGGRVTGSTSPTLTVTGLTADDAGDYVLNISNSVGQLSTDPSGVSPMLTILPAAGAPQNITLSISQSIDRDWNSPDWSDENPASISFTRYPGSTYEVLPGGLLRTPVNPMVASFPLTDAWQPSAVLKVDGNGVWINNPLPGNTTIGELRLRQVTPTGTVIFKQLIMNGGQIKIGNDGLAVLAGEVDILGNTPIYNDVATDRGLEIDSLLTGTNTIEYHGYTQAAFQPGYTNALNVTGNNNTFNGRWDVVIGTLLGTGNNALGHNTILVETNGALETTYDLQNTNGILNLNGRLYLHQNDVFSSMTVNGTNLAAGTYSFASLNTAYPSNFPASWVAKVGAGGNSAGSGSIHVLNSGSGPAIYRQPVSVSSWVGQNVQFTLGVDGTAPLSYQWRAGAHNSGVYTNLADVGNITGSGSATLSLTNLVGSNTEDYEVVVSNGFGVVTSSVASLFVSLVVPPGIVTQPVGQNKYLGESTSLTVIASGDAPLSYQWLVGMTGSGVYTPLADGGNISGSGTATLNLTNVTLANGADYIVVITNSAGSVTSSVARVVIYQNLHLTSMTACQYQLDWGVISNGMTWATNSLGMFTNPVTISGPNAVVVGNTYEEVTNGHYFGITAYPNQQAIVRTPWITTNITFAGDSLMIDPDTELCLGGHAAYQTTIFPGVEGKPGLILNGGVVICGVDYTLGVGGKMVVAAQSYICPADPANAVNESNRSIAITATLSGSANLVLLNGMTNSPNIIGGTSNTFSGQWIVKAGWLWATNYNALGTNSITIDPYYTWPADFARSGMVNVTGPAALEANYNINSAGTLTLTNGGQMRLHQNCFFNAVNIETTSLAPGTYTYAYLNSNFPTNFTAGGSGSITVQAYSAGPAITTQPLSQTNNVGQNAQFSVTATGTAPLTYQWRAGFSGVYTNLANGTNISGATNTTLIVSNLTLANAADYIVVVTDATGSVTSSKATLTVQQQTVPPVMSVQKMGGTLQISWTGSGALLEATNLLGPWTTNLSAASPFTVTPTGPAKFYRVKTQ